MSLLRNCFIFSALLSNCILEGDTPEKMAPKGDNIKPFAAENEFKISKTLEKIDPDYRNTWPRLSGYEFSGLHWNHFVVVYVNQGADIYKANYFEYANHYANDDDWGFEEEVDKETPKFIEYDEKTIFLKEHFTSENGKPAKTSFITAMEKMPEGYDPKYGNWRYIWMDGVSGAVLQDGNSENSTLFKSCIECHANMAERDYIFATVSRNVN